MAPRIPPLNYKQMDRRCETPDIKLVLLIFSAHSYIEEDNS